MPYILASLPNLPGSFESLKNALVFKLGRFNSYPRATNAERVRLPAPLKMFGGLYLEYVPLQLAQGHNP